MSSTTLSSLVYTPPETVQNIRKYYDLDKPGKMDEAVSILEDWIKMQNHFRKKDFNRNFLEMMIIQSKGSLERTKNRLDKYCTLRTMLPKYFEEKNLKTDFEDSHKIFYFGVLPKFVGDYYRVSILKVFSKKMTSTCVLDYYKLHMMVIEYALSLEYFNGVILVLDYSDIDISELLAALNLVEFSEALRLCMDCFGLRLKGVHLITASKLINAVLSLLHQFLSQKLLDRIHVHKNLDSLFKLLPRDVFPEDYGGKEKSMKAIRDDWVDALASEECMKYLKEMKDATTDEERRDKFEFNTKYMGLPGTFRTLSVD